MSNKSKKANPYPNKKAQWAYFMQAIEPMNDAINVAFPEYHPMWVIQSQSKSVSAGYFQHMRKFMLNMTVDQCAAYVRVSSSTVRNWESGKASVPFAVFELLRVVFESAHFRLSNKDWQGWFIDHDGRLVSPDRGSLSFSANELSFIRETHQVKSMYETENKRLRSEIEPLRAEIAELRASIGNDGLLDELKAIESRLAELTSRVSSSKVVSINNRIKSNETSLQVKAA